MHIFQDRDGRYFVLLPEVWDHIIKGHPEIEKHIGKIGDTLANPFLICRSKKASERHLYYWRLKDKLMFVVVVDIIKGIIKTSYITDRIKGGEIIWQAKK